MTTRAKATQADIRRAIRAALASGLRVLAVHPDGTVVVDNGAEPHPLAPVAPVPSDAQGWGGIHAED